jgi:hypothetical protein
VSEQAVAIDATITFHPKAGQVDWLRSWLRQGQRAGERECAQPFLIVTPLGLPSAAELARALAAWSIHVAHRECLPDWPAVATALYVRGDDDATLLRALAFEQAWDALFPHGQAECWLLAGMADFAELVRRKKELRAGLPARRVRLVTPGGEHVAGLHPFHVPDLPRLAEEWGCLNVVRGGLGQLPARSNNVGGAGGVQGCS